MVSIFGIWVLLEVIIQNCPCMDHCESGCPCKDFDCDLALNVTDPVYGLESLGIMEPIGKFEKIPISGG